DRLACAVAGLDREGLRRARGRAAQQGHAAPDPGDQGEGLPGAELVRRPRGDHPRLLEDVVRGAEDQGRDPGGRPRPLPGAGLLGHHANAGLRPGLSAARRGPGALTVPEQVALTVVTPVKPEAVDQLKAQLEAMGRDPAHNGVLPFGKLPNVHYARFVVLDPAADLRGETIPPRLLFLSDADGSLDRLLDDVVALAGERLDLVYGHCADYPPAGARTPKSRLAYLRAHGVPAIANYVNTRGRTVEQIRGESRLRDSIEEFLDRSRREWPGVAPEEVRAAI